jgi:virginiamycin B lyase
LWVALVLGACSSGAGTPNPPTDQKAQTAVVEFSLHIPSAATATVARTRRPDYVSAGTNSISIAISSGGTAVGSPTVLNCTSGSTCSTSLTAPIGADTFSVTLYSGANATGNVLGLGSAAKTIVVNTANVVSLTLNGVVNSLALVVTSPTSLPAGSTATETVTVNALDAAGYTIVAPGGYVDASGNPVAVSVSRVDYGNGKGVTVLTSPSPQPTITGSGTVLTYSYNGSDIDQTQFTATTTSKIAGSNGTASVTYIPTYIKKFADTASTFTNFITAGPDGNLWFTDFSGGTIGSIVPSTGAITHYTIPTSAIGEGEPEAIVAGPNNTMYFAEFESNAIGSINTTIAATTGALTPITETLLTTTNANPRGVAYNQICGGNIFFTEFNGNKIGMLSLTTMTVTEYTISTAAAQPDQIACGADGNYWFTEYAGNKIGQVTPAGVITEYALPNPTAAHGPIGITAGADGSMWFTEYNGNMISSIATAKSVSGAAVGTITEYPLPAAAANPFGTTLGPAIITKAPDGDLFFSETNSESQTTNAMIGRFTTSSAAAPNQAPNVATMYPLDATANEPYGITTGPDGHMWYTEQGDSQIGYLIY